MAPKPSNHVIQFPAQPAKSHVLHRLAAAETAIHHSARDEQKSILFPAQARAFGGLTHCLAEKERSGCAVTVCCSASHYRFRHLRSTNRPLSVVRSSPARQTQPTNPASHRHDLSLPHYLLRTQTIAHPRPTPPQKPQQTKKHPPLTPSKPRPSDFRARPTSHLPNKSRFSWHVHSCAARAANSSPGPQCPPSSPA